MNNTVCYADTLEPGSNLNPDHKVFPLGGPLAILLRQMTLAIIVNHGLIFVLQRLRQPRIVADIISVLVLSPSILNRFGPGGPILAEKLWDKDSIIPLECLANVGLLYTMFIKGLHTDLTPIARKTVRTMAFAWSLVILPFAIGCASYLVFCRSVEGERNMRNVGAVTIFWGTIIGVTNFPTLASILANLKLLCTDIGRDVLPVAMMNDVFSWSLITFTLAILASSPNDHYHVCSPGTWWVLFLMILLVLFCALVIRPVISMIADKVPKGENYSDFVVLVILFLVFVCGIIADSIGSHFIFGAFVLGLCIPDGLLASTLIEKMEACVVGALMPLYLASIGLRLDVKQFFHGFTCILVIFMAVAAKPLCTVASSFVFNMPIENALAHGNLLNAKGTLPLVMLQIGHERGHLTGDSFSTLLLITLLSTAIIVPTMSLGYRRVRKPDHTYEQRTLEGANPINELQFIVCIHAPCNVPSIVDLLEFTNITTQTPVSISAVHLVELVGQASAMFVEHTSSRNSTSSSWGSGANPFFSQIQSNSDKIINAFDEFQAKLDSAAFVQTLTIVSDIDTMHEDICSLAEDKEANLILLSFHKRQGAEGNFEDTNIEFRVVNENMMAKSPCSVGLLVDRGLGTSSTTTGSQHTRTREKTRIAVVYIGGPDDREALTYAWRMASHPCVSLTVIRFLAGDDAMDNAKDYLDMEGSYSEIRITSLLAQIEKEKQHDEEFLDIFRQRIAYSSSICNVCYIEKVSNSGEETVNLLREMHLDYDLYIVGRGHSTFSPLTTGLVEWTDCPELGPVGDILVTSDFASNTSVLVIQQHSSRAQYINADHMYNDDEVLLTPQQPCVL